jgi:hypothetical protein
VIEHAIRVAGGRVMRGSAARQAWNTVPRQLAHGVVALVAQRRGGGSRGRRTARMA